jgi:hypothetical protein
MIINIFVLKELMKDMLILGKIASIMKKSRRQIENLLYNAKASLKTELERRGFAYEE